MDSPATPTTSDASQQLSASAAAFATSFTNMLESLKKQIRLATQEQSAAMRLLTVVPPGHLPVVLLEVTRRTEWFSQQWVQGPYQHDITPRTAALQSVTHDLANGWFL